MPWSPKRHVPPGSRSEADRKAAFQRERTDDDRQRFYRSAAWRRVRLKVLSERPLCEECAASHRVEAATVVDHQLDVRDRPDLALTPSNLRPLCESCHNRKTARSVNARRGR